MVRQAIGKERILVAHCHETGLCYSEHRWTGHRPPLKSMVVICFEVLDSHIVAHIDNTWLSHMLGGQYMVVPYLIGSHT